MSEDQRCDRCGARSQRIVELLGESERLRTLAIELWGARRNLAFGPSGEAAVLRDFPWIGTNRFVSVPCESVDAPA